MLLTITNYQTPATDLGYLLHKNPARVHEFKVPFGNGYVFYPQADEGRCTAALYVEVDPRWVSFASRVGNPIQGRSATM